jgi:hypothetical protein
VVGGADSINIHMVSSLGGGVLLVVVLDPKHFVESAAIVFIEGVLFFPFAMQFDCFFRPMIKGPDSVVAAPANVS